MSQEQLKTSFEKITDTMKILTQDFENIGKLFEGNQTIIKDDEKSGEENKRLLQELKRIGFQELYSIFVANHVKLAEDAWDLDFSDLTSIGVPHIQAKKFVKAVEKDVSGVLQPFNDQGKTKLHIAIEKDDINEVRAVLDEAKAKNVGSKLIEMSMIDNNGLEETAFTMSCTKQTQITKLLLENNADLNKRVRNVLTPLQKASRQGNLSTVELLLDNGVNVDSHSLLTANGRTMDTVNWNTPLVWACKEGHIMIIKKLIEHNANAEATEGPNGNFPFLANVVERKQLDVLEVLLTSELKWTEKCFRKPDGRTILHMAAARNNHKMVELILNTPVGKALINDQGEYKSVTPLGDAICFDGDLDMAKLLIENGAKIKIKSDKKTPLKLAKNKGKQSIADFLDSKTKKRSEDSDSDSGSDNGSGKSGLIW